MRHLIMATLLAATSFAADRELSVLTVAQVTKSAVGVGSGGADMQGSAAAIGYGAQYTQWWGANGASLAYSSVRSNAEFVNIATPSITLSWPLNRHEFVGSYVHRWRRGFYAGGGAGVFLTNGGWAPGGVVGLDSQFLLQAQGGYVWRLPHGLSVTSGVAVDFYRAPNFSDSAYKGGRTVTLEPRFGISWTIPQRKAN